MATKDQKYINFSEDYELNYILKRYNKRETNKNRELIRNHGQTCKNSLGKRSITHETFYQFLEKYSSLLNSLE